MTTHTVANTMARRRQWLALCAGSALLALTPRSILARRSVTGDTMLTLATTTSVEHSGLLAHLLPKFSAASGFGVRVIAVGSGQALDIGRRGDADVVWTHDPEGEAAFVAAGYGRERIEVMTGELLLVGPADDPARAAGADVVAAFRAIHDRRAPFVSRGDRSGTHTAERKLWQAAGLVPDPRRPAWAGWYRETGSGMGPALNTAAAMNAYVLTDRATWLAFRNPQRLVPLVQGDSRLAMPYAVIALDRRRHPHVRDEAAHRFIEWLRGAEGQQAIAAFRLDGRSPFQPVSRGNSERR